MSYDQYERVYRATTHSLSVLDTEKVSTLECKDEVERLTDTYTVTIWRAPRLYVPGSRQRLLLQAHDLRAVGRLRH